MEIVKGRLEEFRNPFNGIESSQGILVPPLAPPPVNPFNGIERGLEPVLPYSCVKGIHSMELKDAYLHRGAPPARMLRIHSMELKVDGYHQVPYEGVFKLNPFNGIESMAGIPGPRTG